MADVGIREMARRLGCSPALVSRYSRRGMPLRSAPAARAWIAANVRPIAGSPLTAGGSARARGGDLAAAFADARARRARAEADRAELQVRHRAGVLLDRAAVEAGTFNAFRELRNATENALRDAADHLAGLTDAREIEQRLLTAYAGACDGFEGRLHRALSPAPGAWRT